jgi:hypothetical protein
VCGSDAKSRKQSDGFERNQTLILPNMNDRSWIEAGLLALRMAAIPESRPPTLTAFCPLMIRAVQL